MADDFDTLWGTGGAASTPAPTGTTVLDPAEFDKTWLQTGSKKETEDTNTFNSAANAALGGIINGIPIVGPALKSGTEKFGAKVRSMIYGTPYADELKAVQNYDKQSAQAHSGLNTAGEVTGAVAPMLVGAGVAPKALGLAGTLAERIGYGAGTNALINGADALARGQDPGQSAGIGALVGGGLPVVGKGLGVVGRALLSPPADTATNRLVQRAADLGIPLRPAQISTSPFVNKLDQMVGKIPGSGMGALVDAQHEGFNRAVANTFGENASAITPDVMAAAKKRIGADFDAVEKGTTVQFDHPLISDLKGIVNDASGVLEPGQIAPLNNRINAIIDQAKNGEFDGETFNNMMKKGAPLSRLQSSTDPNVKYYAGQIRSALQDALERSATPEMAQKYNRARYQYKNLKTVQPLAEKAPTGDVSPLLLAAQVRKANPNFAYGSGGDLADIARIGQRFMRQPPDSGTPLGNRVLGLLAGGGAGLAAGVGGYAAYNGSSPVRDTALGLAGLLGAGLTARGATTLLNRPEIFSALYNRAPSVVPAYNQLSAPQ